MGPEGRSIQTSADICPELSRTRNRFIASSKGLGSLPLPHHIFSGDCVSRSAERQGSIIFEMRGPLPLRQKRLPTTTTREN
jgi:hypothetical protein